MFVIYILEFKLLIINIGWI